MVEFDIFLFKWWFQLLSAVEEYWSILELTVDEINQVLAIRFLFNDIKTSNLININNQLTTLRTIKSCLAIGSQQLELKKLDNLLLYIIFICWSSSQADTTSLIDKFHKLIGTIENEFICFID
jgi:hypothetical protein